jgi:hypothetical protein
MCRVSNMSDQPILGRAILGTVKAKRKEVCIEEWGGNILIQQLSHGQKSEIDALAIDMVDTVKRTIKDKSKLPVASYTLLRLSWIDEEGRPILLNTPADYEAIMAEPDVVIDRILSEIRDFNGMTAEAKAEAKKNSAMSQNGDSGIN